MRTIHFIIEAVLSKLVFFILVAYMLFHWREGRIEKNFARGLEYTRLGPCIGDWGQKFFSIRTDEGQEITYLFFAIVYEWEFVKSYFLDRKKLDRLAANQSASFARIPDSKKINCVINKEQK